jgi:hypothetical protein
MRGAVERWRTMKTKVLFEVVIWTTNKDGERTGENRRRDVVAFDIDEARRRVNAGLDEADIDVTEIDIRPFLQ